MADCFDDILLWNKNHSHPEYHENYLGGELCIHNNGIVFNFKDKFNRAPLVIHWQNLTSTYIYTHTLENYLSAINATRGVLTLKMDTAFRLTKCGAVSIKYKDVEFDKIIVLEFIRPYGLPFTHERWAKEIDSLIWKYKKDDRWS